MIELIGYFLLGSGIAALCLLVGYQHGRWIENLSYIDELNYLQEEINRNRESNKAWHEEHKRRSDDIQARIDALPEYSAIIPGYLRETATQAYIAYFEERLAFSPTTVEALKTVGDEKAIEILMDKSDQHSYAWPNDEHPNYEFVNIFLDAVDWQLVLARVRLYVEEKSQ